MSASTFPYTPYAGDNRSPTLQITLLGTNGVEHKTPALIDTGAEWSMLSVAVAVQLGADIADPDRCFLTSSQHAGGVDEAWWWSGSAQPHARPCLQARVAGLDVSLAPLLKQDLSIVALGRRDFLAAFRFSIDERAETFTLEPYNEPADQWMIRVGRRDPD